MNKAALNYLHSKGHDISSQYVYNVYYSCKTDEQLETFFDWVKNNKRLKGSVVWHQVLQKSINYWNNKFKRSF